MNKWFVLIAFMVPLFLCSCESKKETNKNEVKSEEVKVKEFTGNEVKKDLGRIPHDPVSGKSLSKDYFKIFLELMNENPKAEKIFLRYEKYYDKDYSRFEEVEYDRNLNMVVVWNTKSHQSERYFNLNDNKIKERLTNGENIYWDVLK